MSTIGPTQEDDNASEMMLLFSLNNTARIDCLRQQEARRQRLVPVVVPISVDEPHDMDVEPSSFNRP